MGCELRGASYAGFEGSELLVTRFEFRDSGFGVWVYVWEPVASRTSAAGYLSLIQYFRIYMMLQPVILVASGTFATR